MERVYILLLIISIAGAVYGYYDETSSNGGPLGQTYHTTVQQFRKEKCQNERCKLPDAIRLVISINLENKRRRRLNKKRCKNKRTISRHITVNLGNIKRFTARHLTRHIRRTRHSVRKEYHSKVQSTHTVIQTINAKNVLRRFRQLGVRLIGHGIVYHSFYYEILCSYTKLYTYLTTCKRRYGGITECLPHLYSEHLIGHKSHYKKYGIGYGLGVLFAKGGIVYHNRYFRFRLGRKAFITYITVCLYRTGKAHTCLLESQANGYLRRGETHQQHVVTHGHIKAHHTKVVTRHVQKDIFRLYQKLGVRLIGRGVVYHDLYYSIKCSYTKFYRLLLSCKNQYGGIGSCFERLYTQHLIGRSHTYKKYGYEFGLGLTFVKGGIVYGKRFFRFLHGRDFFIRYITRCIYEKSNIHTCLVLSQKEGCIGSSIDYQQYITTYTTVEHTHVSGYAPSVHRPQHTEYHVVSFYHVYGAHGSVHGSKILEHGVVYHQFYRKLLCSVDKFHESMSSCHSKHINMKQCFQKLYQQSLIGSEEPYKKSSIGVTFVEGGVLYQKRVYRLRIDRQVFIQYITKCLYHHSSVQSCIYRAQSKGYVERGEEYKKPVDIHNGIGYQGSHNGASTYHVESHTITIGHLFSQFRRLGVSLVGNGIVYHGYYYKLQCTTTTLYKALQMCTQDYGGIGDCIVRLSEKGLLGHQHKFVKFGRGYGLGVTFVKTGVVFEHHIYKYLVQRRQFVQYMTVCINTYKSAKLCLRQLQKQKLLGVAHTYRKESRIHHHVTRRVHVRRTIKIISGTFRYHGHVYKLRCRNKRFYRLWGRCISHHHRETVCMKKLHRLFQLQSTSDEEEVTAKRLVEPYGVLHPISVGHLFGKFRRLGVRLVGLGILYHRHYYKLRCQYLKMLKSLQRCRRMHISMVDCLPHLQQDHLIGDGHIFKKYGYGYGLRVKFVRSGILYRKKFYKFRVRRRRFIHYMTVCIDSYKNPGLCLAQLHKQGMVGVAQIYRRHIVKRHRKTHHVTVNHSFQIYGRRLVYQTQIYRLRCSKRRFNRVFNRCIKHHHREGICMKRLHKLYQPQMTESYGPPHAISVGHLFGRFRKLGVRLVGMGVLYHGRYYKLRCRYLKVLRSLQRCRKLHINIANCLAHLQDDELITKGYRFKKYGFGYGLHVKFVRHGVLYRKKFYKFLVRRRRFIHYMTVCIATYKNAELCLAQLNKQRMVDVAHAYRSRTLTKYHALHRVTMEHSFKISGRRLVYHAHVYRLKCGKRRFYRAFNRCIKYHHEGLCMKKLHRFYKHWTVHANKPLRKKWRRTRMHAISVGHLFGRFRRFGVRLIGHGILYSGQYYKLHCQYLKLLKALRRCRRMYGDFGNCVPHLQQIHLIGKGHIFKRFGYGYGLHVKFVKRGVLYHKKFYKFRVRRRRFIHYMTVCMDTYHKVIPCLNQLRRQKMVMAARNYRSRTVIRHRVEHSVRVWNTIKITGRRFTYNGKVYRLRCRRQRFYKLWNRCMQHNQGENICIRKLHRLFRTKSRRRRKRRVNIFRRFKKLGVNLVGLGITYHRYYYRFRCKYRIFLKALRMCRKSYGSINKCLLHLKEDGLLSGGHKFKKYGYGYGLGVKFVKRGVVYRKNFYRFIVRRRRFIKRMTICAIHGHGANYCIRRLQKTKLLGAAHMYNNHVTVRRDVSLNNFVQHITRMVTKEFTYNGNVFKLRCRRARFYKLWNRCMTKNNNIFVCFLRLHNLFKIEKKDKNDGRTQIIHRTMRHQHHIVTHHVSHRTVVHVSRSSHHFGHVFHTFTGSGRIGEDEDIGAARLRRIKRRLFKTRKQAFSYL